MDNTFLTRLSRTQIDRFYAQGHWQDTTIYGYAQSHALTDPDHVALRGSHYALSYAELVEAADRLASHLTTAGVRTGQRVAVWLPSRAESAVALLACSRMGFVMSPSLHRTHTVGEVVDFLETMRAAALISEVGYGADARDVDVFGSAWKLGSMRAVLALDPLGKEIELPFAVLDGPSDLGAPAGDPDSIVYLAFTSGTTGRPKGVLHSDNTLLANARALAADWAIGPESIVYSFSPVSHNLGFGAMVMSLMSGAEFVMHDAPRGTSLSKRLRSTGATFVVGVPTHAIDLIAELDDGAEPVTTVGGFRLSGASGSRDVVTSLLRHGILPQSGYGMTEGGSHHYTLPTDDVATVTETSGRACAGFEARVFDRDDPDRPLGVGEVGHIGTRGASLMLGYYDDQAATEDAFNAHGWFMTGDLGWIDDAGYIRITGRIKDVIIRGGHNIYPAHIEDLAMRHESVVVAAAIAVKDDRLGERVCLVVATRNGEPLDTESLLTHLSGEGLSRFDMPEFIATIEALPLTASGKILKRALAEAIADGRITPEPVGATR
jgi:acyl-CoA synthetase (AMP-forming)/AMP-acid ligase II